MDLRTVLTFSSLLLLTAGADHKTQNSTTTPIHTVTDSTSKNCTCPSAAPAAPATTNPTPCRSEPDLSFFTIKWTKCDGYINLIHSNSSSTLCYSGKTNFESLLRDVCVNRKGCEDTKPDLVKGKNIQKNGYDITASTEKKGATCEALKVRCKVEHLPDVEGQLHAYKVVTALLCCILLILLLIRFTRPTVKALQKRLSDRRQNRWIGPTQSHSVSYHRGKSAVKNNDGEKRVSYPALERLAVSDSREPSSNRNSDYNF
ncbi:uncharacterized protein LOC125885574 [Epinephelus fuscoguttatus]|uniref:uncharacterized protein LOC125885574 n=1 Tax=Epinephelus fuscoguttatus TaxID=293821 RepID=UPI0020D06F90|nr:uncharacterized protein LOC125885574 [Epinephelus fuscoguttatus]